MSGHSLKEMLKRPERLPPGHRMCAGCGATIAVRAVLRALKEEDRAVIANATGCLEVSTYMYPYTSWEDSYIHNAFENAGATLSGVETAYQVLKGRGRIPAEENFKFIADGYSAYPLAAMEFVKKFGKDFTFRITQVIGLTNDDAVSKEHRPFKQMIERLNRTYKASYRHTNGFDNIDGANYDLALWVAYYNFLRPHKHNNYKVLNEVEMLQGADNMPGKWQLLIFLGQRTILNMQKTGAAASERSCCQ